MGLSDLKLQDQLSNLMSGGGAGGSSTVYKKEKPVAYVSKFWTKINHAKKTTLNQ